MNVLLVFMSVSQMKIALTRMEHIVANLLKATHCSMEVVKVLKRLEIINWNHSLSTCYSTM